MLLEQGRQQNEYNGIGGKAAVCAQRTAASVAGQQISQDTCTLLCMHKSSQECKQAYPEKNKNCNKNKNNNMQPNTFKVGP